MDGEDKTKEQLLKKRRIWLPVGSMFVLLCILVWLNEIVDFPHLLLGAPHTPINWREAIIETVLIASVGLFAVLRLARGIAERKRTEEEIRQRTAQLEALRQVGLEVTAQLDLDALLHSIVSRAIELLGGTSGGLDLYRPEQNVLEWTKVVGHSLAPAGTTLQRGEGLSGKVWETGKTLIVNDYQHWEGRAPAYEGLSNVAVVGAPMHWGEKFLGVLIVEADPSHTFSPADAELLGLFANQAAIAIRNARIYEQTQREIAERKRAEEEIRRRNRELAALNAIATIMMQSALNLDEVLQRIADGMVEGLGCNTAVILLLNEKEGVFKSGAVSSRGKIIERINAIIGFPLRQIQFPARSDFSEAASNAWDGRMTIKHDLYELVSPVLSKPVCFALQRLVGSRTFLSLPLLARGKVVGGIFASTTQEELSEGDTDKMMTFANQAAIAIDNARLYEEAQQELAGRKQVEETLERRAVQLATLNHIGRHVASILDQHELLQHAVDSVWKDLEYPRAAVLLVDEGGSELYIAVATDNFWEVIPDGHRQPVGKGAIGMAAETGEAVLVKDASSDSRVYRVGEWFSPSSLSVPIKISGRVIGVLEVEADTPNAFDENDQATLEIMADQVAGAIENARLHAETQRRLHEQTVLREAGAVISSALDLNTVLTRIAEQMCRAVDATSAYICRHQRETMTSIVLAEYMSPQASAQEQVSDLGASYPEHDLEFLEIMEAGEHYISQLDDPDISESERAHMEQYGAQTILYIPLLIRGQLIGFAELWESRRRREFTTEELALCQGIAQQAAIAIENARLFEEIEERRMYLEGVLGAAPDAIVTLNAQARIVEWNSGAERLFGYSRAEVIGQDLDDLITSPDVFEEAVGFTQMVMGGKGLPPTETVRYRKDGSPVDVLVAGSPILVGDEFIGAVIVYTDITARVRMEEALRALLLIDELTGLYNRRGFSTLTQQQLKMADRAKRRMLLLFADFDDLKRINDTFGHPEGDRALIEIAGILRATFRESDIVARIGGDEFVVLAIETDGAPAEVITARLQENLEAHNAREDRRYKLSLSIGIAHYDPEHPCSINELLAQADRAMYEKKQQCNTSG
jgi:diguanylate cyclase (GGDEF)-like protein/PAS domain S-box-containing protein